MYRFYYILRLGVSINFMLLLVSIEGKWSAANFREAVNAVRCHPYDAHRVREHRKRHHNPLIVCKQPAKLVVFVAEIGRYVAVRASCCLRAATAVATAFCKLRPSYYYHLWRRTRHRLSVTAAPPYDGSVIQTRPLAPRTANTDHYTFVRIIIARI